MKKLSVKIMAYFLALVMIMSQFTSITASAANTIPEGNNLELLVKELNRYENLEIAHKYIVASNLYNGIKDDMTKNIISDSQMLDYYQALKKACDDAAAQFNGTTYPVKNVLSQDSSILDTDMANVTFTNSYGSSFAAKAGETIQLLPGIYNFVASISELEKKATGKFEVKVPVEKQEILDSEGQQSLNINFPGDKYWISGACFEIGGNDPAIKFNPVNGLEFSVSTIDNSKETSLYAGITWSDKALEFTSTYRELAIKYVDNNATVQNKIISNSSSVTNASTGLYNFIPKEGMGRKEKYIATLNDVENRIVFTQEYRLNLQRSPRTLSNLSVEDQTGTVPISPLFNPTTTSYEVSVLDNNTSLKINPMAFSSYKNGYSVVVNGILAEEGGFVTVPLKAKGETQDPIQVEVRHQDDTETSTYVITPKFVSAVQYEFTVPKGANVIVKNAVGGEAALKNLNKTNDETDVYQFTLAEGQPYFYTVTQNSYYKTSGGITAINGSKIVTVDTNDHIDSFQMLEKTKTDPYLNFTLGNKIPNKMAVTIPDYSNSAIMNVSLKTGMTDYTMIARYISQATYLGANAISTDIKLINKKETTLKNFIRSSGAKQNCELIVSKVDGEFIREQVYVIELKRELNLSSNTPVFVNNTTDNLQLVYATTTWNRDIRSGYVIAVSDDAKSLKVILAQNGSILDEALNDPAYTITVNGLVTEASSKWTVSSPVRQAVIPLNGTKEDEKIEIELSHPSCESTKYEFKVKKVNSVDMTFDLNPKDARFTLSDSEGSRVWPDKDGKYSLLEGSEYKYVLSKTEYVTLFSSFIANSNTSNMELKIERATKNDKIDPTIDAEWNKFRGEDNNGVTKRATPTSAEDAQLRWAYLSGGASNTGQPIVLDNYVAVMSGNKLQYIDSISGKLVAEGKLENSGGVAPSFSNGMIFVPGNSVLQAFNATPRPQKESDSGYTNKEIMVIDSLWVYKDPIGGGGSTPFYVKDGYIYGGWQQVSRDGAFVCLSITDEDPTQSNEIKEASWRWIRKGGGFFWAGAHVSERFVVVGGEKCGDDDLVCLDTETGAVLDKLSNIFNVENRGCVSYDKQTDRYCLVSKDEFFTVRVDANGKFYSLKRSSISGMSTSTPAIFNGRAYIGCSGNGQFQSFTGAGIMVLDIESAQPIYAMKTRGYPQSSGLISTAYMNVPHLNPETGQMETGFVYVYFDENVNPGNISYIIDKPGITAPVVSEDFGGVKTAPLLLAPKGAHANYCLSSLQVDKYGTLYMKTDAGYILAIGAKIETLEVRKKPKKTVYLPGEKFDPTGMKVFAKYLNGTELDVTNYVIPMYEDNSGDVLNVEQSSMTLKFNHALYNNLTPNDYIDSKKNSTFDKLPRPEVAVAIVVMGEAQVLLVADVIKEIDKIDKVTFIFESKEKINSARRAYAAMDPNLKEAVTNFQKLLEAEERYDFLTLASQNRLPLSDVVKDTTDKVTVSVPASVDLKTPIKDLIHMFTLSLEELDAVEKGASISIGVNKEQLSRVPDAEQFILAATLQKEKLVETGSMFDLSMFKKIGNFNKENISELYDNQKVRIEIPIPKEYQGKNRLFYLVNIHGSKANVLRDLAPEDASKVVIETGLFSTYVLTYAYLDTNPDKITPTPMQTTSKEAIIENKSSTMVVNVEKTMSNPKDKFVSSIASTNTEIKKEKIKTTDEVDLEKKESKKRDDSNELTKKPSAILAQEDLVPAGEKLALILWISLALVLALGGISALKIIRKKKSSKN